jgi:hypothetical protein
MSLSHLDPEPTSLFWPTSLYSRLERVRIARGAALNNLPVQCRASDFADELRRTRSGGDQNADATLEAGT